MFVSVASSGQTQNVNDSLLNVLSREIKGKALYDQYKLDRISNIKSLLNAGNVSLEQEYNINNLLADEYRVYTIDSAILYMEKNKDISLKMNNEYYFIKSLLHLVTLYATAGMYIESQSILSNNINRSTLSDDLLIDYYEANRKLNGNYGQSNGRDNYFQKNEQYQDSLLLVLDPKSTQYRLIRAQLDVYSRNFEPAERLLNALSEIIDENDENYGTLTYLQGTLYGMLNNKDLQVKYLALSAISDIRKSVKDNASMNGLAIVFFGNGGEANLDLAYQLTKSAIEDAVFCNVRFRTVEISGTYDIISTAYQKKMKEQEAISFLLLLVVSTLFVVLCFVALYVYWQMKRLSLIKKELYRTNIQLQRLNDEVETSNKALSHTNHELYESNHIKEEYIAHFFDLLSTYVSKLEDYRKTLNKLALNNKLDELFKAIKSTNFVDKELEELYKKFDSIFLSLYPTFVEEFNSLLKDNEQIVVKQGELLNTELRIFALIRLGITDSIKIAGFLRYSLSTIYNYRTKLRNKAAVPRDDFEDIVSKIGEIRVNR